MPKVLSSTSVLVVAVNGAEARGVATAGGSRYHGAVLVPHPSGVEHTSRETRLGGAGFVCGEVTASPETKWVSGEVFETSGGGRGFSPSAELLVGPWPTYNSSRWQGTPTRRSSW